MDRSCLWRVLVKVTVSLLCAGVFYFVWMAAFLMVTRLEAPIVEGILWVLAPVVTGTGFAVGIVAAERTSSTTRSGFFRTLMWPLMGCAIGASIVYWFGPMLIVFGMFVVGTASVTVGEVVAFFRSARVSHNGGPDNKQSLPVP